MKCLFGHKFGRIEEDGWQYCERCGKAQKPNPCAKFHQWEELERWGYSCIYGTWKDFKVVYRCKVCSATKTEWLYGH